MKNRYDENYNEYRDPQGGIIVFPPGGEPFIPGQGPGPVIPPWLKPGLPEFPPVPEDENDKKFIVKIKSVAENEFVVVGEYNYLYATGEKVNKYGIFKLIILDGNRVKLRLDGGSFIRVDDKDFLVADTDKKGATKFYIYQTGDKEYVLQAPNGYYVRAREKDKKLIARAENPGQRTIFKFKTID